MMEMEGKLRVADHKDQPHAVVRQITPLLLLRWFRRTNRLIFGDRPLFVHGWHDASGNNLLNAFLSANYGRKWFGYIQLHRFGGICVLDWNTPLVKQPGLVLAA